MPFLWTHSRVSFGQTVRAAKRAGRLRYYRCNAHRRLAVLTDGSSHTFRGHTGISVETAWNKPREYDGADTSEAWAGGFAENH